MEYWSDGRIEQCRIGRLDEWLDRISDACKSYLLTTFF